MSELNRVEGSDVHNFRPESVCRRCQTIFEGTGTLCGSPACQSAASHVAPLSASALAGEGVGRCPRCGGNGMTVDEFGPEADMIRCPLCHPDTSRWEDKDKGTDDVDELRELFRRRLYPPAKGGV